MALNSERKKLLITEEDSDEEVPDTARNNIPLKKKLTVGASSFRASINANVDIAPVERPLTYDQDSRMTYNSGSLFRDRLTPRKTNESDDKKVVEMQDRAQGSILKQPNKSSLGSANKKNVKFGVIEEEMPQLPGYFAKNNLQTDQKRQEVSKNQK